MTSVKEIDIVYNLTRPSSDFARQLTVRALVEHLHSRKNYLDDALADLVSMDGNSPWHLELKKRDARREPSEDELNRDVEAFEFVRELTGQPASQALIEDIERRLDKNNFTIRADGNAYVVRKNGLIELRVKLGEPISERRAVHIASLLPGAMAFETIRTMVAKTKKAVYSE